ncbi:hypothetical protein [Salinivibrio kushneri]|uniref:hypothetical protein n=1 Tax=Salinivibrio kushneri TaxID=1908198 RepID=UPI000C81DFCA|nr:hypothetical protein [Salinivibrio kushneri]
MKILILVSISIIWAVSIQAKTITSSIECKGSISTENNGWSYKSNCKINTKTPPNSIIQHRDEFEDKPIMYSLDIRDEEHSKRSSIYFQCDASTQKFRFNVYAYRGNIKVRFDDHKPYEVELMDRHKEALWMATNGSKGIDYSSFSEKKVSKFIDDISTSETMRVKNKFSTHKYELDEYGSKMKSFTNLCQEMKNNIN